MSFDAVAAYHREHGDDYGNLEGRWFRYQTIKEMAGSWDKTDRGLNRSLLDVGCGKGKFLDFLSAQDGICIDYTGIDLIDGQNVLDHHTVHDIVVAGGIFYQLDWQWMKTLIAHMWLITGETLIFNTLSSYADEQTEGVFYANPIDVISYCARLTHRYTLRTDYLPHDFTVAMYK